MAHGGRVAITMAMGTHTRTNSVEDLADAARRWHPPATRRGKITMDRAVPTYTGTRPRIWAA